MIVLARICLHQDEAEESIAVLKSRGFTVLSHVFPDEPDHVFLEATREALTMRPGLLTRNEVLSRVLDEFGDVLPMSATISKAGPIPPVTSRSITRNRHGKGKAERHERPHQQAGDHL